MIFRKVDWRLLWVSIFLLLLAASTVLFPRKDFPQDTNINFLYFANISSPDINTFDINTTVVPELHRNSVVLSKLHTYVVLDPSIFSKNPPKNFGVLLNGISITDNYLNSLHCNFNVGSGLNQNLCVFQIPNDLISSQKVNIEVFPSLFKVNNNHSTFVGVLFVLIPADQD